MKPHIAIICASIFIFCWLILGFRGLDAGVIGPGCFVLGIWVQRKEQAVAAFFERLKSKYLAWI